VPSYIYTADSHLAGQTVSLVTNNRLQARARIASLAEIGCFDTVVRSLSDLPAPSGGYYDLPSGSYCIAAPIDLGANALRVPAGNNVYIQGGGLSTLLTANGNVLRVQGTCLCDALAAQTSTANCVYIEGTGQLKSTLAYWTAPLTATCVNNVGLWQGANADILGAINSSGTTSQIQTSVSTSSVPAVSVTGGEYQAANDYYNCTSGSAVVNCNNISAIVELSNCSIYAPDPVGAAVLITTLSRLIAQGGYWRGNTTTVGNGLQVAGNVGSFVLSAIHIRALNAAVRWTAGTVDHAMLIGIDASSVSTGVTWPAANMPFKALAIVGGAYIGATAFDGFSSGTARVNIKACIQAAGLASETAIVP
jgi:hypothetical protein